MPADTYGSRVRARSAEELSWLADALQVDKPGAFTAGVVQDPATGKVIPVTRCNGYAVAFMCALGVKLPAEMRADQLHDWLSSDAGRAAGWEELDKEAARQRAELGFPVLAVWHSADGEMHGHIAVMVPAPAAMTGFAFVSAAGAPSATFRVGRIEATFGASRMAAVRYFAHA